MKVRTAIAGVVILLCAACSSSYDRNPVPVDKLELAAIPNIPNARYWADEPPANLEQQYEEIRRQRQASGLSKDFTLLALSGGADDGAFGAGVMRGWTETGDRPEFIVVTGVSTGGLSAPFVFLGPDHDSKLSEIYGGYPPEKIFVERAWYNILPEASAADSSPLKQLIATYANEELLAEVAAEHKRGRRLYVQTTHLDAQRPVLWDLGAIASSGAPNAPDVFRKALLASASVPVAFPPVVFEVEVDGQPFDEIHADGGVIAEDTVLSAWQKALQAKAHGDSDRTMTFFIIRNGRVVPEPKSLDYDLRDLAGRSVSTLIKSQGIANLHLAYEAAQLRGADYYATWIGSDFQHPYPGPFDPGYMRALAAYGEELIKSGKAWRTEPPPL